MPNRAPLLVASVALAACRPAVAPAPVEAPVAEPEPEPPKCVPPERLEVLFIGNSYMLMHDLPSIVAELGDAGGVELDGELLAKGGKDFEFHLANRATHERLAAREWDYVILQSHSLDPVRNRDGFLAAGEKLIELVREAGAEPLLFETWARDEQNKIYRFGRAGYGPDEMQEMVHDAYAELSRRSGAQVIDVGAAWLATRSQDPDIDLYARDLAHPNKTGSYLTATVIFTALTGLSPVEAELPPLDIAPDDARRLHRQAEEVIGPQCELPFGEAPEPTS